MEFSQDQPSQPLQALAAGAAAGDETAFEAVYARLHRGLCGFLKRRGLTQDSEIEEVAQRTWVEVWRGLQAGRYDPQRGAISTFVYAVGYHLYLQHRRQSARQTAQLADANPPAIFDPADSTGFLDQLELLDALRDCLSCCHLTADERQILDGLLLSHTERQMADTIGLAPSTINARKKSALEKLRECLRQKGFGEESIERIAANKK